MEFRSDTQTASFHSPLEDFEPVEVDIEVREDPLTGRQTRIAAGSFPTPEEDPDIEGYVEDDEGCFFCPDTVEEVTPTYPSWVGVERGRYGEAVSFPNLNPYGSHSNVVVLTEDHYRPIDALTADHFANGLAAALDFVTAALDHDEDATHASVNMNFLRPAGSSIVHPHLQTVVDDRGTTEQQRLTSAARDYREAAGSSYWSDLLDAEQDGERHVGSTGGVEWLAPFAPRHHRHVRGLAEYTGVPSSEAGIVEDFADGLPKLLSAYAAAGLNSFNFALFLGEGRRPIMDVIARSVFDRYYWSDSPFFTVLHDEGVVDVSPEEYAAAVRDHF